MCGKPACLKAQQKIHRAGHQAAVGKDKP